MDQSNAALLRIEWEAFSDSNSVTVQFHEITKDF